MADPQKHPMLAEWYGGPHDGATTTVLPAPPGGTHTARGEVVYQQEGTVVARYKRVCPIILRAVSTPHPLGVAHRLMADWTQGEWVESQ